MIIKYIKKTYLMSSTTYVFFMLILFSINIFSATATVNGIRVWRSPENTRIVFDLNKKPEYKDFTLDKPTRLVIDINNARFKDKNIVDKIDWPNTQITKARYGVNKNNLRVVLDLSSKIKYKIFSLPPNGIISDHRIVVDISNKKNNVEYKHKLTANSKPKPKANPKAKLFKIVIDPGHGGDDPGAIGAHGTKEKEVVLKISKYLKQYINKDKGLSAIMTRDSDYFIGLRDRTEKARANQADLFVSIHADGFHDKRAKGASVFVLSERGASSELAKWIADNENASDLVGGVSLDNKDTMLATVLLDLSQTASNSTSYQVANNVLQELSKVSHLHKSRVEKAGFVVLKSPDIPSILVETGFISNERGERNLRTTSYQRKIAYSIYKAIKSYFKTQPRPVFEKGLMQAKND